MNIDYVMSLADAYAFAAQGYNQKGLNEARAALEAALSAKQGEQEPTCKQDLQVPTVKECLTVQCWVTNSGQFSFEPQDERYWTRMVPAPSVNAQKPTNVGALALDWYDQTMENDGVITRDALHMFALSLPVSPAPSVNAQEPCDMGQICLNCQPRGLNGECPDKAPEAKQKQVLENFDELKQEPVNWSWVDLQNRADEIVRGKSLWKRFIDGTPLSNDIACWMADFAQEVLASHPAPVNQPSVRVGHLHISRHPEYGIWLRHDSGEAMQTDEDKLYRHLSEYWNKEF